MKTTISAALILGLFLGAGGAGCSSDDGGGARPPEEGDAFLTVVGETNVFMENGWQQAITVRYHDGENHPLAGEVGFAIRGPAGGATLSAATAVTDRDGKATVTLAAGATGEAAFTVDATAEYADPASWRVAIHRAEPSGPLDPAGRYRLTSQFDLVSGLPGTVGEVTNTFIDMTDSPHDPATWLLDRAVSSISDSTTRSLINATRPALDAIVNDALRSASPGIVTDILEVGNDFGQVARKFGTQSTLEVTAGVEGFSSKHTLTHVVFTVDGQVFQFPMADLGMSNLVAGDVAFATTDDRSDIGNHQFPMSYGSVLLVALEDVVIPLVDPAATDLNSFFTNLIDCDAVGVAIADYIGIGSASLYRGACQVGINAASNYIRSRIQSLDSTALLMKIGGRARPLDTNTDRKIDLLQDGAWTGTMTYGSSPVTLGTSTFRGDRMAN
ncbi:MAG TPA: hypothetical protein VM734_20150 [Kofleriaceae bacterium]|nr:hypothetical protein [Kofleriaceae bacterium]